MVYLASEAALALLEVRVHLDLPPDLLPEDYVLVHVALDGLAVETVAAVPADAAEFGDAWLRERRTPVLRVPSLIVPESANLLLNPAHPAAAEARIIHTRPFRFDPRLWQAEAIGR